MTDTKQHNLTPLLVLVFSIPLMLGLIVYLSFKPLRKYIKRLGRSWVFWCVFVWFVAGGLFLGIHAGILDFDFTRWLASIESRLTLSLINLGVTARLAHWMSNYLLLSVPLSFVFAGLVFPILIKSRQADKLGSDDFKKDARFRRDVFEKNRMKGHDAFIGMDRVSRRPVYLTDYELSMHAQVIGSTGFGKTSSVLLPLLNYNLSRGHGMVVIDGKAEHGFFLRLKALVKQHSREKDFQMFSTVYTDESDFYNPLRNGFPTDVKDKLIGSQIWSEEFYKKKGEQLLLLILNAFQDQGIVPTFRSLERAISHPQSFSFRDFTNDRLREKWGLYRENHARDARNYAGIAADISLLSDDLTFGHLFDTETEGINLLDAYQSNKIIYFHLPVLKNEETVKRIGRLIIHDLKDLCALVHTTPKMVSHYFPVYIDEFASFAFPSFTELLNKSRSAGVAFTLLHQSLGDIESVSPNYAKQITENTNIKIILRIDDPETIETQCRMIGTKKSLKYTYQTDRHLFSRIRSGGASLREVDEYIVDPNEFRNLQVGDGIVIVKSSRRVHRVKFDHLKIQEELLRQAAQVSSVQRRSVAKNKDTRIPETTELAAGEIFGT